MNHMTILIKNNDFKKLESKLKRFVYNIILVHVKRLTIKGNHIKCLQVFIKNGDHM
ncbi:Uncharacterised protein [Mycobacteroides abscessus]|nr:Uncharacterised protein [Mycobacteroides abscessus]